MPDYLLLNRNLYCELLRPINLRGGITMTSKILVTGANGGFGILIVNTLLARGQQVAASMRDPNGRNAPAAAALRKSGAVVVEIDVTDTASVEAGVAAALAELGGLDVVINNAGVGVIGLQESFTAEDYQRLFDINVFGVQRVNRAVIPHMRGQERGLLMHVSSLLGRITIPFYGPYNSTKWALEAMAENYRSELSGFGIETVIVEPGGFPTSFIDRLMKPSDVARSAQYGAMSGAPGGALKNFEAVIAANPQQNPQRVADVIATLIDTPHGQRAFRTTVDFLGMGNAVNDYNAHMDKMTRAIYGNFGIAQMLEVAV
jgi:NAD(P)-dependent dehydrogenase (short-subunit alcohol dehydrogenase family)